MSHKILVILGSTRENRYGDKPAHWITGVLRADPRFDPELVDLRDWPLPLFDQPRSPVRVTDGHYGNDVADRWGAKVYHELEQGIAGADVVMMLRLQLERMQGALVPSTREYFRYWGLDREKLKVASDRVRVMHPGPMNRGVEIDSDVADDPAISLIQDQVEMGVAARMAVLASLSARLEA